MQTCTQLSLPLILALNGKQRMTVAGAADPELWEGDSSCPWP